MEPSGLIGLERFSFQSINSLAGNERPLRRMRSRENLRSEEGSSEEYLTRQHPWTGESAETISTRVTESQELDQWTLSCKNPHIPHQCSAVCNADYRPVEFGEGEVEHRYPRPMTAYQLPGRTCYRRRVLRQIWLPLVLISLPMLLIPILLMVLVIKYRVESERSLFSEVQGARHLQQRAYVLLNIPASKRPLATAQDEC